MNIPNDKARLLPTSKTMKVLRQTTSLNILVIFRISLVKIDITTTKLTQSFLEPCWPAAKETSPTRRVLTNPILPICHLHLPRQQLSEFFISLPRRATFQGYKVAPVMRAEFRQFPHLSTIARRTIVDDEIEEAGKSLLIAFPCL